MVNTSSLFLCAGGYIKKTIVAEYI